MVERYWPLLFLICLLTACPTGGTISSKPTIVKLELIPNALLLTAKDQSRQLSAKAYDAKGNVVETTFMWRSSNAPEISVDTMGNIHAVTELGSALIYVEAAGIRSAPALIATVETKPNTLFVSDAQVLELGEPLNLAEGAFPVVGTQYEVKLAGISAPEVGTIVLASETAAVAGKVVSSQSEGESVRVRLETLALPDLLARYEVDWEVSLVPYDIIMEDSAVQRSREADGSWRLHYQQSGHIDPLADGEIFDKKFPPSGRSPLSCSASVKAYVSSSFVDLKLSGKPELIYRSSKKDASLPPDYTKLALSGDLVLEGSLGISLKAGFKASGECRLTGRIIIPVDGPLSILAAPAIPIGVGAKIEGELKVVTLELAAKGTNGANLELGFECDPTGCHSLDKVEPINKVEPKITAPTADNMRVELGLSPLFFVTGLDAVLLAQPFNLVDVTIGPKQAVSLAFPNAQARDTSYASNYDLKFEISGGPGEALEKIIKKFTGKDTGNLSFDFTLSQDLAKSPVGTLSVDKTSVGIGGKVNLSVDLEPSSTEYFLLGYNVESIEFYRRLEGESDFSKIHSIPIVASNQTLLWQWTPSEQDVGKNEFAAFVKTKMPVVELELAANSVKEVQVECFSQESIHVQKSTQLTAQAAVCEDAWTGTSEATITDFAPSYEISAQVTWRYNAQWQSYLPEGTVFFTSLLGCTITPSSQPISSAVFNGELRIDYSTNPPSYQGVGQTLWEATYDCPDQTPFTAAAGGTWFMAEGTLSPDGKSIGGTQSSSGQTFTFSFTRQ